MVAASVLFIDCDDCIYQNNWATARKITQSISSYTASLGVSQERAYSLYKTHGTCLKGLLLEGLINEAGVEDFLMKVRLVKTRASCRGESLPPFRRCMTLNMTTSPQTQHWQRCSTA